MQDIKAIRLRIVAIGLLAGFGVAFLVSSFAIAAGPPTLYWDLMLRLVPFIVLGIIVFLLWIRKPLSASDALRFVIYLWVPFFLLYLATTFFYLLAWT